MDINKLNISKIETFLDSIIDNVVSKNTFVGSKLPDKAAIPSDWKDMCLIDIPNGIDDLDAQGKGTAIVYLYARPMESGKKSVGVLSPMEEKLNEVIISNSNPNYSLARRLTYTGYDTDIDWHFNAVEIIISVY